MRSSVSEATVWRIVAVLSVVEAGAYVGTETARYFWDLTAYVQALDTDYPWRFEDPYPFLYPPFAADLFTLARSHLFELLSIAYVAAIAFFLAAFAQLNVPRRFEWLFAITAMGGLGVVSLLSGNIAILLNLTVLALALQAAMGKPTALQLLPIAIGVGALIKPQFALYLGLLLVLERSRKAAVMKALAVGFAVAGVHTLYMLFRPDDWNEYVQAVVKRTVVEKDFAWGPAGFMKQFSDSSGAAFAAYLVALLLVSALAHAAWQKFVRTRQPVPGVALVSLAFVVLTFANPRMPLYDLYAAAIALSVCCALAGRTSGLAWVLVLALSINLIPWSIANFARVPSAWPWWLQHLQITHLLGIGGLLVALSRVGCRPAD
ncbi:MAG: glycosyltransferase 87 family protein [Acidobacteriota bacterium]|nr:glycosyltransferase 87 family protein [Acidobacteriota bacterium]